MKIPLLIVSDGPNESTGLGKIARDLAGQIAASDLPVDLLHVGGPPIPRFTAWPHVPMGEIERAGDWGRSFVEQLYRSQWGSTPGIVWVIWDPSRLAAYTGIDLPVQLWSYPAIDAANRNGTIGGPAAEAIRRADRVIAYGRWASTVLQPLRSPVPYLPHGLTAAVFAPTAPEEQAWVAEQLGPQIKRRDRLIGCVATNQPRKDLALYCETLAELLHRGHPVYGWLHTDTLVKAWSVPELIETCGLTKRITVSLTDYDDRALAALYQACTVTVAPGLGEGFGYPIVESLANGTPVVHGDVGGGRELVPKIEWRFPVREVRVEGVYALRRPVFRATDVANAIERVWRWQEQVGPTIAREYCRGAVAHLEWSALWPRWRGWIRQGIDG